MKRDERYFSNEVWYQDLEDRDLWHGRNGVIVNTAALNERAFYVEVIRIAHQPSYSEKYAFTFFA
jgi:hypothetical protein